jgi:hypothetical protein
METFLEPIPVRQVEVLAGQFWIGGPLMFLR